MYTLNADASGYSETQHSVCFNRDTSPGGNADFTLTKSLDGDTRQFVLTWGLAPRDLDIHGFSSSCHVYFASKDCTSAGGWNMDLDRDDTTSYGPETLTIAGMDSEGCGSDCSVDVRIFDYSGEVPSTFRVARALVKYFDEDGLEQTMQPDLGLMPDGCRWWTVGVLSISRGTFTAASGEQQWDYCRQAGGDDDQWTTDDDQRPTDDDQQPTDDDQQLS